MKHYLTNRTSNFGFDLMDMMDDFFAPVFNTSSRYMSTDVKENDKEYTLYIDLPGFEKEDLSLSLKDGYVTVSAKKSGEDNDTYLRRERKMELSRSYFVGKDITEDDVKAKYVNGTLTLTVPKAEKKIPETKTIRIE